ncbi:hypothetical protein K1T71_003138 [Dendrolimus kikuchii]|uniref:Uncharacterized protein n=1 Tax=Dendrolimus kikuchii TaxID=765133 RepID=A0ACC1DAV3_9NEOP|nr:hypothetical protein K1T71_003138 [Dendrolimus kikuchii]
MRQSLVPVLLLAAVALSSSNILPVLSISQIKAEPFSFDNQQNDNIFISDNRFQTRDILKDKYLKTPHTDEDDIQTRIKRLQFDYIDTDSNPTDDLYSIMDKNNNYNGEGFRQEQWHNYPRQLDRLNNYLEDHQNADKRNLDPDDLSKEDYPEDTISDNKFRDKSNMIANEFQIDINPDTRNFYDAVVAATNPLLILKIRLAYLSSNLVSADAKQYQDLISRVKSNNENLRAKEENVFENGINPTLNMNKVKREGVNTAEDNDVAENTSLENKSVKKRIFSLWSRLQGLNHKGHELHHRRHLHAFYGMPDSESGGTLTAETRATLMRPPGSPLRWG